MPPLPKLTEHLLIADRHQRGCAMKGAAVDGVTRSGSSESERVEAYSAASMNSREKFVPQGGLPPGGSAAGIVTGESFLAHGRTQMRRGVARRAGTSNEIIRGGLMSGGFIA